jgi:hypothetical protein
LGRDVVVPLCDGTVLLLGRGRGPVQVLPKVWRLPDTACLGRWAVRAFGHRCAFRGGPGFGRCRGAGRHLARTGLRAPDGDRPDPAFLNRVREISHLARRVARAHCSWGRGCSMSGGPRRTEPPVLIWRPGFRIGPAATRLRPGTAGDGGGLEAGCGHQELDGVGGVHMLPGMQESDPADSGDAQVGRYRPCVPTASRPGRGRRVRAGATRAA